MDQPLYTHEAVRPGCRERFNRLRFHFNAHKLLNIEYVAGAGCY